MSPSKLSSHGIVRKLGPCSASPSLLCHWSILLKGPMSGGAIAWEKMCPGQLSLTLHHFFVPTFLLPGSGRAASRAPHSTRHSGICTPPDWQWNLLLGGNFNPHFLLLKPMSRGQKKCWIEYKIVVVSSPCPASPQPPHYTPAAAISLLLCKATILKNAMCSVTHTACLHMLLRVLKFNEHLLNAL